MVFFAAYAGTTPLFSVLGVHIQVALILGVYAALYTKSLYECIFLALAAVVGSFRGVDIYISTLLFGGSFISTYAIHRVIPWRPFLTGLVIIIFFSFFEYISWDAIFMMRLAPQFVREALYNVTAFAIAYTFMPHLYARKRGRY